MPVGGLFVLPHLYDVLLNIVNLRENFTRLVLVDNNEAGHTTVRGCFL
ncbi:MAG: hypothetical protein UW32_C0001G0215 [Candidatus Wolfebacteria bacterium GW2011_GWE2_44_13]|uniref:Uncharacterized protein n=1 Tax=Candidatus Wolfebacteria bacterium GW2011_GWE2_44_13 TaxID=1619017 RepID=A0A0G1HAT1_9BACT|nr:MAG: hypothetical protein UW32_C0001G0215 [Candidatus Wolfebacteria bacterium GW2011_GWE2_44_13]